MRKRAASRTEPVEQRLLVTAILFLVAYGAVMVYSASSARTLLQGGGNGTSYLVRYLVAAVIGFVLLQVLSRTPPAVVRRLAPLFLIVCFALVVLVLLPGFGIKVNGARRWLGAGPLQFQPSELLKLALVLYAAQVLTTNRKQMRTLKGIISPLLLVTGAGVLLVLAEPDLGTGLVIAFTTAALLIAGGVPLHKLATLAIVAAGLVMLFALLEPYRRARLTMFLDPWADPHGAGFQAVQGQIALGSGGLFGVGLGESVQKAFYLPEAHTDFVLAVIGEELGVIGVLGVLTLYGLVAHAGLRVARSARSTYAKLVCTGVIAMILSQATLNVFAVLGLAPLTGVPLPFISYAPTNLIVLLAGTGVLLGAARAPASAAAGRDTRRERAADDLDRRRRNRGARRTGAGGRRRAAG